MISNVLSVPESLCSCCYTTATPAGRPVTSHLHWHPQHIHPFEWKLHRHVRAVPPCRWLSVCWTVGHFWEQDGCDEVHPRHPALARPLHSASGNPFSPPHLCLWWQSRSPEGPATLSHSDEPWMNKHRLHCDVWCRTGSGFIFSVYKGISTYWLMTYFTNNCIIME